MDGVAEVTVLRTAVRLARLFKPRTFQNIILMLFNMGNRLGHIRHSQAGRSDNSDARRRKAHQHLGGYTPPVEVSNRMHNIHH